MLTSQNKEDNEASDKKDTSKADAARQATPSAGDDDEPSHGESVTDSRETDNRLTNGHAGEWTYLFPVPTED